MYTWCTIISLFFIIYYYRSKIFVIICLLCFLSLKTKLNGPFSDLNLIDWSPNYILAVALGANLYLWNGGTGTIQQLLTLEGSDYVCSVSWIQEGNCLAVGTSMGVVQVCYVTRLLTVLPIPASSKL
jgi:WD40 repeat protein